MLNHHASLPLPCFFLLSFPFPPNQLGLLDKYERQYQEGTSKITVLGDCQQSVEQIMKLLKDASDKARSIKAEKKCGLYLCSSGCRYEESVCPCVYVCMHVCVGASVSARAHTQAG